YLRWVSYFTPQLKQRLFTPELQRDLAGRDGGAWLARQLQASSQENADPLDALLSVDIESYLPYDLLVKMDIASMANSLEARSPFLDHHVMEFCARLPASYKLRGMRLKHLLKKAGAGLLPPETLTRRKMGFGVPVGSWM